MRLPFSARLVFVLLVALELAAFVGAVRWLGGWPVFWLLLATAFLGGWIIRVEGGRAWAAAANAIRTGQVPAQTGSGIRMLGGFLLVMPGFVTDVIGLLALLPPTQAILRSVAATLVPLAPPPAGRRGPAPDPGGHGGAVIEGEIVDESEPPSSGPPMS